MKEYDKNKEFSYLQYWDAKNLCGWAMLQKLPVNNFDGIEDTSQFRGETFRTLLVGRYFLLVIFFLIARYFLPVARYFLLVPPYFLLAAYYF